MVRKTRKYRAKTCICPCGSRTFWKFLLIFTTFWKNDQKISADFKVILKKIDLQSCLLFSSWSSILTTRAIVKLWSFAPAHHDFFWESVQKTQNFRKSVRVNFDCSPFEKLVSRCLLTATVSRGGHPPAPPRLKTLYLYRGTCQASEATARCGIGEDTSIKIQRNDMPSLTSQFGDTREISSEQYENIAKNHENLRKFQNFILKLKKLALSGAQLMALGLLTPDTHIAREETKKFDNICEKKSKTVENSKIMYVFATINENSCIFSQPSEMHTSISVSAICQRRKMQKNWRSCAFNYKKMLQISENCRNVQISSLQTQPNWSAQNSSFGKNVRLRTTKSSSTHTSA